MRKLKLPDRDPQKPRLSEEDIDLIENLGISKMEEQVEKIVQTKLNEQTENDGRQTPRAGHPAYKAMHACRADSREKLSLTHRIPAGKRMTDKQKKEVINLLMRWIVREFNFFKEEKERQKKLDEY